MKLRGSKAVYIRRDTAQRLFARLPSAVFLGGALVLGGQVATAEGWQVTYGQSLPEYQATEQTLTSQGFRPISLDVDGAGAASKYAVIWRNDGFTNWLSDIELAHTEFMNRIANLAAQGYRVLCLDSHGNYPNERYAAVWVQDEKATKQ